MTGRDPIAEAGRPAFPAVDATHPDAFRSGMLPAFGPTWYTLGMPLLFRRLKMEEHSAARIRDAAAKGPVVYVLHHRTVVDWLALNRVLLDHQLPLPVFTNGIDASFWMPLPDQWTALRRRMRGETPAFDPLTNGWLADCIASGRPTCLFLAPAPDLRDLVVKREEPDPVPALLEAQRRTDRPIHVVPIVVISNRSPEPARREVGQFLMGLENIPGGLGKLLDIAVQPHSLVQAVHAAQIVLEENPADAVSRYATRVQELPVGGTGLEDGDQRHAGVDLAVGFLDGAHDRGRERRCLRKRAADFERGDADRGIRNGFFERKPDVLDAAARVDAAVDVGPRTLRQIGRAHV